MRNRQSRAYQYHLSKYHTIDISLLTEFPNFFDRNETLVIDEIGKHCTACDKIYKTEATYKHHLYSIHSIILHIGYGYFCLQPFFCSHLNAAIDNSTPLENEPQPFVNNLFRENRLVIFDALPVSARLFRQACLADLPTPPQLNDIASKNWLFFWSLALTMVQRNVIYRLINRRIPHKALLNRIFPELHSDNLCLICSSSIDSIDHFLFFCPVKIQIWQGIISEFLCPHGMTYMEQKIKTFKKKNSLMALSALMKIA